MIFFEKNRIDNIKKTNGDITAEWMTTEFKSSILWKANHFRYKSKWNKQLKSKKQWQQPMLAQVAFPNAEDASFLEKELKKKTFVKKIHILKTDHKWLYVFQKQTEMNV